MYNECIMYFIYMAIRKNVMFNRLREKDIMDNLWKIVFIFPPMFVSGEITGEIKHNDAYNWWCGGGGVYIVRELCGANDENREKNKKEKIV